MLWAGQRAVLTSSLPPGSGAYSRALKAESHNPRPSPQVGEQWFIQMTGALTAVLQHFPESALIDFLPKIIAMKINIYLPVFEQGSWQAQECVRRLRHILELWEDKSQYFYYSWGYTVENCWCKPSQ